MQMRMIGGVNNNLFRRPYLLIVAPFFRINPAHHLGQTVFFTHRSLLMCRLQPEKGGSTALKKEVRNGCLFFLQPFVGFS